MSIMLSLPTNTEGRFRGNTSGSLISGMVHLALYFNQTASENSDNL